MNKTVYLGKSEAEEYMYAYQAGAKDRSQGLPFTLTPDDDCTVYHNGYFDGWVGGNSTIYISKDR